MYYRANNDTLLAYCEEENKMFSDWKYTDLITSKQLDEDRMLVKILDGELILNPNYGEEKAKEEAERIAQLHLTGADVERGIYQAKGLDFDDIIALVEKQAPEKVKPLKIELKANNFYRGNPYVNEVGKLLGFTPKQLDEFFETNDYTKLIKGS